MTLVRPLREDEEQALSAARFLLLQQMPYYARAAFRVVPLVVERGDMWGAQTPTMAVDAYWRLYLDREFLLSLDPPVAAADLAHEINHLIRDHARRATDISADPGAWNTAGDAEINDDLIEAGLPLQEWVVTPQSYGWDPGQLAEVYYGSIPKPPSTSHTAQPGNGKGSGPQQGTQNAPPDVDPSEGCGSGAGGVAGAWELPEPGLEPGGGSAPGVTPAEADVIRWQVAEDVLTYARSKGIGSLPSGLERWADGYLAPPKIDWRRELAHHLHWAVAWTKGRTEPTFSRPARRRIPDIILPGHRRPLPKVAIVIDTSGSMDEKDLQAALAEAQGILSHLKATVTVLSVDAQVQNEQKVRSARSVRLKGGGGTHMGTGIARAQELQPRPDVIVVMTDGLTPWPSQAPPQKVLVVVIGTSEQGPPWARTVHVPPAKSDTLGRRIPVVAATRV